MKQDHAGRAGQGLPYPTRLSMILYFLKGSGRYFFAAVFSAALMALLDLINPRIVGYAVDSIIGDSSVETILPLRLLINALGGPVYPCISEDASVDGLFDHRRSRPGGCLFPLLLPPL